MVIPLKCISLLLALLTAPVSAQGLDQRYRQQQLEQEIRYRQQRLEHERVLAICKKQYETAKYWSTDEDSNLKYIITPQGVQGILPDVVQESSVKYKCQRGGIDKPMAIGKTYKGSGRSVVVLTRDGVEEYQEEEMIMYKIEDCYPDAENTCLVKYSQDSRGEVRRNIVANNYFKRRDR